MARRWVVNCLLTDQGLVRGSPLVSCWYRASPSYYSLQSILHSAAVWCLADPEHSMGEPIRPSRQREEVSQTMPDATETVTGGLYMYYRQGEH